MMYTVIPSHLLESGSGTVEVLQSAARWYGVTYREDLPGVVSAIEAMHAAGTYPENLWA